MPYIKLRKWMLTLGWKKRIPNGWEVRCRSYDLLSGFRHKMLVRTEWSYDRSCEHTWIYMENDVREARRLWFSYLLQRAVPHTRDGFSVRIPLLEDKR